MGAIDLLKSRIQNLKKAEDDLNEVLRRIENAPSLNGCPWHVGQTIKSSEYGDLIIEKITVIKQPDTYTLNGWEYSNCYVWVAFYRNTMTKKRGTLSELI